MLNWTMLPRVGEIWEKLLDEILPSGPKSGRTLFVDLADPEKRTREDLRGALHLVTRFQEQVEVILGLNLKEATQVAEVLGLPDHGSTARRVIEQDAAEIRLALGVSCVVIHPRKAAAAATATESARFPGPFVQSPRISTGAGDHFNAGFCLGRVLGMGLEAKPLRGGRLQRLLCPDRPERLGRRAGRVHRRVAGPRRVTPASSTTLEGPHPMRRKPEFLLLGLLAVIAGCAAQAGEEARQDAAGRPASFTIENLGELAGRPDRQGRGPGVPDRRAAGPRPGDGQGRRSARPGRNFDRRDHRRTHRT